MKIAVILLHIITSYAIKYTKATSRSHYVRIQEILFLYLCL